MTEAVNTILGGCHCGSVRFEATLSDGLNTIRRCTCSYCRMRGAVAVSAELGGIRLLRGEDTLTSYRFNTQTAQHFFCSRCGIYTHHQRRSNPNQYGVNVACLDGVSPFDFEEVPVFDGVRHSRDNGGVILRTGTLRYIPIDQGDPA
ncbi:GFA family protein [Novosphingobium terrae]|uniref:GFA family protein n=1 Tax=Novosphingobium terrae TaxID=2726189 RepID=UPI00198066AE|nr:GFA family protein [Novosphingobium terrae]